MPLTKIKSLGITDGTITSADLAAGVGGKVLQVVSTAKTDTFSTSNTSFTDVTGLSVSITPSSSSNKILILSKIPLACSGGYYTNMQLLRDSTSIFIGDSAGNRTRSTSYIFDQTYAGVIGTFDCNITFLDSPSTTSSITYKIQIKTHTAGGSAFLNRSSTDTDSASYGRVPSSITLMEIAG